MTNQSEPAEFQKEAASIETNSYSIVSKRSVEKLYFADEPAFLKPFVSKFRKRAPLINRGYWLRTRAIEDAVNRFLDADSGRPKAVVNLGCGYDPLPFRTKYKRKGTDARFIDVDFPDLIERKVAIVTKDETLSSYLGPVPPTHTNYGGSDITDFGWYCTVGCDLGDIYDVTRIFEDVLDIEECDILFLAEVSITYMPLNKANRLLSWTASYEHATFLLLEQIIPAGPDHPFARTMLSHFAKQTPLQSVLDYPNIPHQIDRFRNAGYSNIHARSLWDYWEDELQVHEKHFIAKLEPFDEWEEYILFASHYLILEASTVGPIVSEVHIQTSEIKTATYSLKNLKSGFMPKAAVNGKLTPFLPQPLGGSDSTALAIRLNSTTDLDEEWNLFGDSQPRTWLSSLQLNGISCYTITDLDDDRSLLVGGRKSPSRLNIQCFLYRRSTNQWVKVHDLPLSRYRHSAIAVSDAAGTGVLIHGGITGDGTILSDWLLWTERGGWTKLKCRSTHLTGQMHKTKEPTLFGAVLAKGKLFGGLGEQHNFNQTVWRWRISPIEDGGPQTSGNKNFEIVLNSGTQIPEAYRTARFGSALLQVPSLGLCLIGGVAKVPLKIDEEIMCRYTSNSWVTVSMLEPSSPRPFLIRVSVAIVDNQAGDFVVIGGGGVCFSFGSCFGSRWHILGNSSNDYSNWKWHTQSITTAIYTNLERPANTETAETVEECGLSSLASILHPQVARNSESIGSCTSLWSLDYLKDKLRKTFISIHQGTDRYLTFTPQKNFSYKTCEFSIFSKLLERKEHVYLRALASQDTFKEAANFWKDFPEISEEFRIPEALDHVLQLKSKLHSSVLRVSGDVCIWIHYDVMSNFYFQIRGSKTFFLFPPGEVLKLKFAPGSTTSPMDSRSDFSAIRHKMVTLKAGDVLFIPRFWAHTTFSAEGENEPSIAINVFWRDLEHAIYAAGKDIYGNRDLAVYEQGRELIRKTVDTIRRDDRRDLVVAWANFLQSGTSLETSSSAIELQQIRSKMLKLPSDVLDFYLPRLVDEFLHLCNRQLPKS